MTKLGKKLPVTSDKVPALSTRCMMVQPLQAVDWAAAVTSWGMLANDAVGDCTAAAALHMIMCWRANTGHAISPVNADAIALYSATSKFPIQDDGAVELDVLKYWSDAGVMVGKDRHKISFATINPKNLDELKLAIEWFGGAYIGVALPISAQCQSEWDVAPGGAPGVGAPNSWGGHAVCLVGYDDKTFTCITWGKPLKMTYAFAQEYIDEAYACLSEDWINDKGVSPPGLDMNKLIDDMKNL